VHQDFGGDAELAFVIIYDSRAEIIVVECFAKLVERFAVLGATVSIARFAFSQSAPTGALKTVDSKVNQLPVVGVRQQKWKTHKLLNRFSDDVYRECTL